MSNTNVRKNKTHLINLAYIRSGDVTITGEALILACLLHTHGAGRDSADMKDVRRIMNDVNLDRE